jgi:hypothetical protein
VEHESARCIVEFLMRSKGHEDYGVSTYLDWVLRTEVELQPVRFTLVYRVRVHDFNVYQPSLEVLCLHKCYARR